MSETCQTTETSPSLPPKSELSLLDHIAKVERALSIAVKLLTIHNSHKTPSEHPEFESLVHELQTLKEELRK